MNSNSLLARQKVPEILFAILQLIILTYAVVLSHILLGVATVLFLLTIYFPVKDDDFTHLFAVLFGWSAALFGYISSDGRFLSLSLLLGISAYIAGVLSVDRVRKMP